MTVSDKAKCVERALDQLADEAERSESYGDVHTAMLAFMAIDRFNLDASPESKARLYDLIKEA